MFDVVKAVNVEINENHLHVSIIKYHTKILLGDFNEKLGR
jgi:hypothetical protein